VWRLVVDKVVSYSELEQLNFKDAVKLNAILDYKQDLEIKQQKEIEAKQHGKS